MDPYEDISIPFISLVMEWLRPMFAVLGDGMGMLLGNTNGLMWLVALIPPFLYFWSRIRQSVDGLACRQHSLLFLHALFWIAVLVMVGTVSVGDGLRDYRLIILLLRDSIALGIIFLFPMALISWLLIGFERICVENIRS